MRVSGILQFVVFASLAVSAAAAESEIHLVKKGETLSKIYLRKFKKPLFAQKNWRENFQIQNPQIKNPNLIFPGDTISFGQPEVLSRSVAAVEASATAEAVAKTAPAPVAVPATVPVEPVAPIVVQAPPLNPTSNLQLELGYEHFRIDSVDRATNAKSIFLSDLSPQAKMKWTLQWSEKWSSLVGLNLISQTILEDDRSASVTLQANKGTRYGFHAGVQRRWSSASHTGFQFNYQERVFTHAPSVNVIAFDRVASPSLKISHEFDLLAVSTAHFGVNLAGEYILPGSGPGYSTKAGTAGEISLFLKHEAKNAVISGSVYYGVTKQDSDLATQNEKHLGALMGLAWKFE